MTTFELFPPSGRLPPDVDELVVYADETGSSNPDDKPTFAVGIEFGVAPIAEAFTSHLQADRTCTPDPATGRKACWEAGQRRPFFHAAEDCWPCRILLLDGVRDGLADRYFLSMRWEHAKAVDGLEGRELHQDLYSELMQAIHRVIRCKRIHFYYEQIEEVSEHSLSTWLRDDVAYRVQIMIDTGVVAPLLPVKVTMVDKSHRGTQVCDHLLWREHRRWDGKPERVADAGFTRRHVHIPHAHWEISLYQHGDMDRPVRRRPLQRFDDISQDRWGRMFWGIQQSVNSWVEDPDMQHLRTTLESASKRAAVAMDPQTLFDLCRAFLAGAGLVLYEKHISDKQFDGGSDLVELGLWFCRLPANHGALVSLANLWRQGRQEALAQIAEP